MMKISYTDQNGKAVVVGDLSGPAIKAALDAIPEGTCFTVTSTIGGKERTHYGQAHRKPKSAPTAAPASPSAANRFSRMSAARRSKP